MYDHPRHAHHSWAKRRTILAFAFLFALAPLSPALAREASRPSSVSTPTKVERSAPAPTSIENGKTEPALREETKPSEPDRTPPAPGDVPETKPEGGDGDEKPSKEEPVVMPITSVNPAALSTNLTPSTIKQLLPEADAATGALIYSYPFTLPPGRSGLAPSLSLTYNNQRSDEASFVGHGWSLSVPFIERLNKTGTGGLYAGDFFSSSTGGELVPLGSGFYAAKVEDGSFLEYEFAGGVWSVRDKRGTIYTYGADISSRQDNPTDAGQVFTWMLSEIRDLNDNFVSFTYDKDAGAIYPASIAYTGHGSDDGIFEVIFIREARPDVSLSYRRAFPVTMNDRLSSVEVYADGDLVRTYTLGYDLGDNGVRSLLTSITETGYDADGAPVSPPAVTIAYEATAPGWSSNAAWEAPVAFAIQYSACNHLGTRVADINGDGLPDTLQSTMDPSGNTTQSVYLNNGAGWTLDPSWVIPRAFGYSGWCSGDYGSEVVDINGDALADIIHYRTYSNSSAYEHQIFLNTGSGWVEDFSWTIPHPLRMDWADWGTRLADINGDGLTDFVWSKGNDRGVALNTGSNWVLDPSWNVPIIFTFDSLFVRGTEVRDVNGDGLSDLIESETGPSTFQNVFLNTGSGWVLDPSWVFPAPLRINSFADYGTRLVDFNGDGLLDVLVGRTTSVDEFAAYINTGSGWISAPEWIPLPSAFAVGGFGSDTGVRLVDVNGDGMTDFVKSLFDGSPTLINNTWLANGLRSDRVTEVVSASGGTTSIEYATPQEMIAGPALLNPETPFVFDVVSGIERDNGFGDVSTYTYTYEGGVYDFLSVLDRKFASFHIRTETDAEGNQTRDYFHQGNATDVALGEVDDHIAKAGRAYRTEALDASDALIQAIVNAWERVDLGNGSNFVKLAQTLRMDYDGDADHRDRVVAYAYDDTNGNVTEMIEWGEVDGNADGSFADIGEDDRTTAIAYAENSALHILGLPSQSTTTNATDALVSDAKAYYDNLSLGSVNIGNETSEERWVVDSEYVGTQKAYDGFGFLVSLWDELGRLTEYLPDVHELYVERTTNALGHETLFAYDLDSGQVTQTTDPNGRISQNIYDGLNRSMETWQSSLSSPSVLEQTTTYAYAWETPGTQTVKTEYFDAASARDTYAYADGFDRTIQTRVQMKDAGTFAVTDTAYDAREYVESQSLPYASVGPSRTSPTADAALLSAFEYDALGRTTDVATTVGNTSSVYDEWEMVVIDPRGVEKAFERDAYDRLVAVVEHNGASAYSTSYVYNARGDLADFTDALGNVRSFTYDGLSRRLTADDLHMVGDATFGVWTYAYDDAGNLVSRTDPRGEVVTSEYDELNREIIRDALTTSGIEAMWSYDFCPDAGIGSVCEIATPAMTQMNVYDGLGRVSSIWRVIDDEPYTISFEYDRFGRVVTTTYPDGSQSENVYGLTGYLEGLNRRESASSPFVPVVTDIEYAPTGKRTEVAFANGATSVNTYNASELYRLRTRTTTSSAGTLQSLTYTYDGNGNVTQIVDASDTSSAKTTDYVYDDLNRLLSATVSGAVNGDNGAQTFSYNALGNIITRSDAGIYLYEGHLGSNYANPHAATSVGGSAITYDESGNVASVAGSASYAWDAQGRLIGVAPIASSSIPASTFAYDPDGIRVISTIGEETTIAPFNGYRVENGTPNKEIFFDDGETVATVEGTGSPAAVRYTHTDHLTGAAVVTDAAGDQIQLLDYHPWGTERINEQASTYDIKRKFAGHESDDELGLSYMLARYYNPSTVKFLSEDPAFVALGEKGSFEKRFNRSLEQFLSDPQLLNGYSYAKNNPLTLLDPTGAAPAIPATQYVPPFHQVLMTSQFNVGMAVMKYGLMYSTAMDIETVTDNQQSTANRVVAGVSLGTMFLGGEASGGTKLIQGGRAVVGAADDAVSAAKGSYTVYRSIVNGATEYIGMTKDFATRAAQHLRNGRAVKPIEGLQNLTYGQARGIEQVGIESIGLGKNGGTLSNKINSISQSNPHYGSMITGAKKILDKVSIQFK